MISALFCLPAFAQADAVFERTYVSTDRQVYLAGDRIWCSAFCFNAESGALSGASAVAYMELVTEENIVASGKIALFNGRGAGYLDIPSTLATGNYALLVFTAQNKNEKDYDFRSNARIISVYNLDTVSKLPGGVSFSPVAESESSALKKSSLISLNVPMAAARRDSVKLGISCARPATVSVSVSRKNHLPVYSSGDIASFDARVSGTAVYENNVLPEYDGEVVYATVEGPDRDAVVERGYATGYLSSIGEKNDTYTAQMSNDGSIVFRTYNIFGEKDLLSQVDADDQVDAHIDIETPFVPVHELQIPVMKIAPSMKSALEALYPVEHSGEFLPRPENPVLLGNVERVYKLDEYTRFPTVKEVFVEIITDVRSRGRGEKFRLEVLTKDNANQNATRWQPSLVMMDGVPVFQHNKLLSFDALKIDRVEIWRKPYAIGSRVYKGIVNLVTKDGGVEYINFGSNVRIVSFTGVSYPMSYISRPAEGADNRETIFWHPMVSLEAGESVSLDCLTPERPGLYDVTVEGVTDSGERFVQQAILRVE